ncbi:agamous MADS-box protein AGL80 [Trifolium repens]|nr:agamous MADS-box protein AGL80 [Trifolium repens]
MTRKKVKLAFISNDATRKITYKKRQKSLLKKVDELSTLCGIDACAIIYSSFDPQPEIWPSPLGVQRVLSKFRTIPEFDKNKKMLNQETFMKQRILKAEDQVKKQLKDNKEKEMTLLMFQCLNLGEIVHNNMSMTDLNHLDWLIDQNLKDIDKRLDVEDNNNSQNQIMTTQNQIPVQMAQPPPPPAPWKEEMTMMMGHSRMTINNADIMQRKFLMDLTMNGNEDETIPFGQPHANLQSGFRPNLLP